MQYTTYNSLILILLCPLLFVYIKRGGVINGINFMIAEQLFKILPVIMLSVISGIRQPYFDTTLFISLIFLGFITIGGITSSFTRPVFLGSYATTLKKSDSGNYRRLFFFSIVAIFFIYCISLILLAWAGGGGTLWLSDSRLAYIYYRNGAGVFYAICTCCVLVLPVFTYFLTQGKIFKRIALIGLILALSYLLASKRTMVTIILELIFLHHFFVKPYKMLQLFMFVIVLVGVFFTFLVFSSGVQISESLNYFNYYTSTNQIIASFGDKWTHFNGAVAMSEVVKFVPRILWPEKPYIYGSAYVSGILYPGAAEKGHTVGTVPWITYYLDFGVYGVALGGFLTGYMLEHIRKVFMNNKSVLTFILMFHFSFTPILKFFPSLYVLLILLMWSLVNRMRWGTR
jgi:hypothetical protein